MNRRELLIGMAALPLAGLAQGGSRPDGDYLKPAWRKRFSVQDNRFIWDRVRFRELRPGDEFAIWSEQFGHCYFKCMSMPKLHDNGQWGVEVYGMDGC